MDTIVTGEKTASLPNETQDLAEIGGVKVRRLRTPEKPAVFYKGGMKIDADGAPDAYNPQSSKGRDNLANAGHTGKWWGIVTDNGKKSGNPVIQGPTDPKEGFYVSPTALSHKGFKDRDPRKYVDSTSVPYIAIPPELARKSGVRLGDYAVVVNGKNQQMHYAIVADIGPSGKLGEGSIALAEALGLNSDARRRGGTESKSIIYVVFPKSGDRTPKSPGQIQFEAERLFHDWGEMKQLRALFREYPWR